MCGLFRHCSRREVEEPDHRLQTIVGTDNCEVGSGDQYWPTFWRKLPSEAQMAVVGIDRADLAKLMPCKVRLNSLHHGVDAGMALATHHWVDIAGVVGPFPPTQCWSS